MKTNIDTAVLFTELAMKKQKKQFQKKIVKQKTINLVAISALEEINKLLMSNAESSKEFDMINTSIRSTVKDALRTIKKIKN